MSTKFEIMRYVRRGLRQGTWPILQRYCVARKILSLPPTRVAKKSDFNIHIRVCERDAIMLHWAVRSFLMHASVPCQLTIHDDGTCRRRTLESFERSFVNVRVYRREEALRLVGPRISRFPKLDLWQRSTYTGIKWLDYYLLGQSRFVIFLDSDVLFFKNPVQLFQNMDSAYWMKDCFYSLYFDREEAARWYGVGELPQLNSGLGRIPRAWFDAALAADVLTRMAHAEIDQRSIARSLPKNDDQTFNAVISACKGSWAYLSEEYCLAMEPGIGSCVARHYVGSRRFWFYEEGIPRAARQLGIRLPLWLSERA